MLCNTGYIVISKNKKVILCGSDGLLSDTVLRPYADLNTTGVYKPSYMPRIFSTETQARKAVSFIMDTGVTHFEKVLDILHADGILLQEQHFCREKDRELFLNYFEYPRISISIAEADKIE